MSAEKKIILLLEDDPKVSAQISEILSPYDVVVETKSHTFISKIKDLNPEILLIDFDHLEKDGLLVYREVRQLYPFNKTIMFSSSNSIPLAVAASKLGVVDFLRKPLETEVLLEAVKKAEISKELPSLNMDGFYDVEWLQGVSFELRKTLDQIRMFSASSKDLVICAPKGVDKKVIAEILHKNGKNNDKKFLEINLNSFGNEASEAHLFLTLKELMSSWDAEGYIDKKDLAGTIFITGVESVPESFKLSLVQFVKDKKSPVKVIFGTMDSLTITQLENFNIPSLSSRKEDILIIAIAYLKRFAPQIKYIAPNVLEFLMFYDFPGNYNELKDLIIAAASSYYGAEVLNFKSLPIDFAMVKSSLKNKLFSKEKYELKKVIWEFERAWLEIVINKVNGDIHAASKFLDIPKTVLTERIKTLELLQ